MSGSPDEFPYLDSSARAIAAASSRPTRAVWLMVTAGVALSWVALATMAAAVAQVAPGSVMGPGGHLLDALPAIPLPQVMRSFVALCLQPASGGFGATSELVVLAGMWLLMSIAMMLPTAAPMLRVYCEIADTAGRKRETVAHPILLLAGYLAVWVAASLVFAIASLALRRTGIASGAIEPLTGIAGASALLLAGLYQFSGLKNACLEKCRNPFSILFARWSVRRRAIFRLGAEQGFWCLGCCWALMVVMFAVGLMNLFWMALIGLLALVEKSGTGLLATRTSGAILLVWGAALLVVSV